MTADAKQPLNKNRTSPQFTRRTLLRESLLGGLGIAVFGTQVIPLPVYAADSGAGFGPLQDADGNGLKLPLGFSSRVIATSGEEVSDSGYVWHQSPDGGATFPTVGGGWVYVSNAERSSGGGGVSAVQFNADGVIVNAYSILTGTDRNCAGGPTPWGSWLSCEEVRSGEVWECDPHTASSQGVVRPLLGKFSHEAAAVDPVKRVIYLTEDRSDGLLYRFRPDTYPDLSAGVLEAAEILDPLALGAIAPGQERTLTWHLVPDPTRSLGTSTRYQVANATAFNGGEGCWYENELLYFTTKGDDRVWRLDTNGDLLSIAYDRATSPNPILSGVDNVFISPTGAVFVSEDPGDLQIVAIDEAGTLAPIVQLEGVGGTEITGPALSPDGKRLYFSSQRNPGVTFEVSGPFLGEQPMRSEIPALGTISTVALGAVLTGTGLNRLGDDECEE